MGFAVVVDSTFDMSQQEYGALGITMAPLNILIDYIDAGTCPCGATVATHLGIGAVGIGFMPDR